MFILIPIGGIGTRFKNNGYSQPKALINVLGKPIVFWLLDNLTLSNNIDFIFIPYNKEYSKYNFDKHGRIINVYFLILYYKQN